MRVLTGEWCLSRKINLQLHFFLSGGVLVCFGLVLFLGFVLVLVWFCFYVTPWCQFSIVQWEVDFSLPPFLTEGTIRSLSFPQPPIFKGQLELISGIRTLPPSNSIEIDPQVQKFLGKIQACTCRWTRQSINMISSSNQPRGTSFEWGILLHSPSDMVTTFPSPDTQFTLTRPPSWETVPDQVISQVLVKEW